MSAPEKPDIPGWFGLRQRWVLTVARPLGPILSGVVILLFALAVAAAGAILLHAIFDLGLRLPYRKGTGGSHKTSALYRGTNGGHSVLICLSIPV